MKRVQIGICITTFALLITGCSVGKAPSPTTEVNPSEVSEGGYAAKPVEDSSFTYELSKKDAESLIEEKLQGKDATFKVQKDVVDLSDQDYYVARVTSDGKELTDYGLAVNTVTGDVMAYDIENNTVCDFSEFPLYNEETDKEYSWFGSFVDDNGTKYVDLAMADSHSFEMNVRKGEKEIFTTELQPEGDHAVYKGEDFSFEIKMTDDGVIEITDKEGTSSFAGTYHIQQ